MENGSLDGTVTFALLLYFCISLIYIFPPPSVVTLSNLCYTQTIKTVILRAGVL